MFEMYASKNAAQVKSYFSDELMRGDYYFEEQEIVGSWGGLAAKDLGLSGTVTKEAFNSLVDNQYPDTANNDGQITPHNKEERRVGYDLTFSAPKSLSVLYEYSKDERLLEAFRDSVRDTMQALEKVMHTRVRKEGLDEDRQTGNIAYAEFVHFTSRPVDSMVPDPQLHSHCFVFNLTKDAVEDRYKAGQFGEINATAPYYEALFHSHLTNRLTALGVDIEKAGKFWTISGIDKSTLDKFSNRTLEIEEFAKEHGINGAKEKALLGEKLRSAKSQELGRDYLRDVWWERLNSSERAILDKLSQSISDEPTHTPEKNIDATAKEAIDFAIDHHLERDSVVTVKRLMEVALREGFGKLCPNALEDAILVHDNLILVDRDNQTYATTKQVLKEEQDIINFTRKGYSSQDKLNEGYVIGTVTDYTKVKTFELGKEQQKVVTDLLNSRHRVQVVQGKAGTGKTTTLATLIDGIRQGGGDALILAPTANAAYDTLRGDGEAYRCEPMQNANTLARFFKDTNLWKESRNKTLIVDEAGLMSVGDMHQLFELADKFDNRIVLVGDISQHNSVMRGDALRILQEETELEPLQLATIRRQDGAYKRAVNAIAKGQLTKGYEQLDKLEAIQEESNAEARYCMLAKNYVDVIDKKESALAVTPTHAEGKKVTKAIRNELKARQHIEDKEHSVVRYRNLQMTEVARSSKHKYEVGQMVRFQQNAKGGIKRSAQFEVSKIDRNHVYIKGENGKERLLDLTQAKHFSVYEKLKINIASGDKIRITEGSSTKNGKRLNNGAIHTVDTITDKGDIKLKNGYILDANQGNITHGYVTTSYASQGKTVDHVFIAQSSEHHGANSREQFYVSVSRGKKSATIFTDNKEQLHKKIQHSHQRLSAIELTKNQPNNPTMPDIATQQAAVKLHNDLMQSANQNSWQEHNRNKGQEISHE